MTQSDADSIESSGILAFLRQVAETQDAAYEDLTGEYVGQFRVIKRLGRGGMGVVYEAEDTKLHRRVALKVVAPEVLHDPKRKARMLLEARAAAAVAHANIATVYDVVEEDGRVFIAMELIEGVTLRRASADYDLDAIVHATREILRGLAKAHAAGIVHRDLKPDNVMVTDDGDLKLLDFGLAKIGAHNDRSSGSMVTLEGEVLGTAGYMAPEQALGKEVDHRADLFAVGVILYEMLAGDRPFVGDSRMEVLVATTRDPPTPLPKGTAPRHILDALNRALAKQPEERFVDADDFLRALDAPPPRPRWAPFVLVAALVVALGLWWGAQPPAAPIMAPTAAEKPTASSAARPAPTTATSSMPSATSSAKTTGAPSVSIVRPAPKPPPPPPKKRKVNLGI